MDEETLFTEALAISSPEQRSAFLVEACGDNVELRQSVEELLKLHFGSESFLNALPTQLERLLTDREPDSSDTEDDSITECSSGEAEFRNYLEPATRPSWLGRLAHYEIEEILGRGAFGIVAKAFDERLHRVVAIKLMSPELTTTSPPRKRFLREARTAAAVTHENIVAIYAVEEEPIPYLVMEYIPGQTLQQWMDQNGPLEVPAVLRIGQQVASGLAAAHAAHLIHRDIKPSNILLSDGPVPRAKISDFGLARAVDDASMTKSGTITGTPMYMAPEQAQGETLDHRADLFSLGSVLYRMTCGRPPFRAPNTVAVLKRVCEDTPRPLKDVLPGTPGWLETIIFRLLEKERDDRYQTAQEVADLLARCQRELEHNGKVACVEERSGTAKTQVFQPAKFTGTGAKKKSLGWLVGGVIAVAAVIGLVLMNAGKETLAPDLTRSSGNTTSTSTTGAPETPADSTGWHNWPADAPKPAIAPFDASQDKQHQQAWSDYLGVGVQTTNSIGIRMQIIPPGEFMMGSSPQEISKLLREDPQWATNIRSEGPQHKEVIAKAFRMSIHEVTRGQFRKFVESTGYKTDAEKDKNGGRGYRDGRRPQVQDPRFAWNTDLGYEQTDEHPVVNVSWNDAVAFCNWLSKKEGIKYQLPTEIQWEYACRAGTTTRYCSGDDPQTLGEYAWFDNSGSFGPKSVGLKKANAFGLFDMHGNVWEWCRDKSNTQFPSARANELPDLHIGHGGAWSHGGPLHLRSAWRESMTSGICSTNVGFRVVSTLVKKPLESTTYNWLQNAPPPAVAPFDAEQAQQHQRAWAAYLGVPVEKEVVVGKDGNKKNVVLTMVLVPPGEFMMGSSEKQLSTIMEQARHSEDSWALGRLPSESPQHRVHITSPYYLGKHEVTQSQWQAVMRNNPSSFNGSPSHPVEQVSWNDAQSFLNEMNSGIAPGEMNFMLPTEAQWEYACRVGTTGYWHCGDREADVNGYSWMKSNADGKTHDVGQLKPNSLGLYDMHGNVLEWCADWHSAGYYAQSPSNDPSGPSSGRYHSIRGGGWKSLSWHCRSATRPYSKPGSRSTDLGFRLAAALPDELLRAKLSEESINPSGQ